MRESDATKYVAHLRKIKKHNDKLHSMKTGFFAYSGQLKSAGESIEEAIQSINDSGIFYLRSWRNYTVNGKIIINEVTKAIDDAEYFCADLTGFSDNVLFELGYAMAKNKPIFLLLDATISSSVKRYKELSDLSIILCQG